MRKSSGPDKSTCKCILHAKNSKVNWVDGNCGSFKRSLHPIKFFKSSLKYFHKAIGQSVAALANKAKIFLPSGEMDMTSSFQCVSLPLFSLCSSYDKGKSNAYRARYKSMVTDCYFSRFFIDLP